MTEALKTLAGSKTPGDWLRAGLKFGVAVLISFGLASACLVAALFTLGYDMSSSSMTYVLLIFPVAASVVLAIVCAWRRQDALAAGFSVLPAAVIVLIVISTAGQPALPQ